VSLIAKPLAFSCPHIPLLDPGAKEFLFEQILEHKPTHIIGLGDWHEADAVNRFGIEYDWTLGEEMQGVADFMKDVREWSCKATSGSLSDDNPFCIPEFIFMEGNHDYNIRDWHRSKKQLVELIDYRNHNALERELRHWRWHPYEYSQAGVYRLGQLSFCHGFNAGIGADQKMALTKDLVLPYGLYVGGHTHRPKPIQEVYYYSRPLGIYTCNAGTLGDIWNGFTYMQKKDRSAWGQAVFVGECELWRYTTTMIPNQKRWDGEVRVRRMFNERS
jgi:predicted phosphodiesterase